MEKIKWTDKIQNAEIFNLINKERNLLKKFRERRHKEIVLVYRNNGYLTQITEGSLEGKRTRGRPRQNFIKQIQYDVQTKCYGSMKKMALSREF